MALTKMNVNVNNIQALSDRPNTADGLTSAELKERFDKAGADIKTYLNNTLTVELDTAFNNINQFIQNARATEYPIGRIVMFYDNEDHSNYLGYTWQRCLTGKVPVGIDSNDEDFDTIAKTGGEKKHTLTVAEMPSHNHNFYFYHISTGASNQGPGQVFDTTNRWVNTSKILNAGGNTPHNILQPYEVVSFWRRVS